MGDELIAFAFNQRSGPPPAAQRVPEAVAPFGKNGFAPDAAVLREEIRRLIIEELTQLAGG